MKCDIFRAQWSLIVEIMGPFLMMLLPKGNGERPPGSISRKGLLLSGCRTPHDSRRVVVPARKESDALH